ncbi:OmpA family protein [Leptospira sp. 96542]|nr:OmpA family protein [Leptospira sp. 96542]
MGTYFNHIFTHPILSPTFLAENQNMLGKISIILIYFFFLSYSVHYLWKTSNLTAEEGYIFEEPYKRTTNKNENENNLVLYFKQGSDQIPKPDQIELQNIANQLIKNNDYEVYIFAHAFEGKSDAHDLIISEKRSLEVERFLKIHFVPENRIRRLFFGNSKISSNTLSTSAAALERKVEVKLVRMDR